MRRQFRIFLYSNPVGRRIKRVLDNKFAKVGISYVFIIATGMGAFVWAKMSVDQNRVEIMRSKRRIREAEKKYAEEYYQKKRTAEEDSS